MTDEQSSQHSSSDHSVEDLKDSHIAKSSSTLGNNSQENGGLSTVYSSSDHEVPIWSSSEGEDDPSSSSDDDSLPIQSNISKMGEVVKSEDEDTDSEYEVTNASDSDVEVASDDDGRTPTPKKGKKKVVKNTKKKGSSPRKSSSTKKRTSTSKDKKETTTPTTTTKASLPTIDLDGSDAGDDRSTRVAANTFTIQEIPLFSDIRKTLDSSERSNLPYFSPPIKGPAKRSLGGRQMSAPVLGSSSIASPAAKMISTISSPTSSPSPSKPELPRSMSVSNVGSRTLAGTSSRKILSVAEASRRFGTLEENSSSDSDISLDEATKMALMEMAMTSFKTPQSTKPKLNLNMANKTDVGQRVLKKSVSMTVAPKKSSSSKKSPKKHSSMRNLNVNKMDFKSSSKKPASMRNLGGGKSALSTIDDKDSSKAKKKKKKNSTRSRIPAIPAPLSPNTAKELMSNSNGAKNNKSSSSSGSNNRKGKLQKSVSMSAVTKTSSSSKNKKAKKPKSMSKLTIFEDSD